jgi:hypothetical protein
MLARVTSLLIGKDIDRTASLVITGASENIADGEVVVLDKNKNILLAANASVDFSDVIYIVQALGTTYTYTNPSGTSVTCRRLKFSNPIEGKLVKKFSAVPFDVKGEKTVSFAAITGPLTVGTEWCLRVVYKDIHEKRGQFTKTYRFTATATTSADVYNGLRAAIRNDAGARITVNADNTAALVLTGKEITSCTSTLTDIDKFSMVDFDAFLTYITSTGYHATATGGATKTDTNVEYGSGNWEQVRDLEKGEWGYEGITNRTQFPVILPVQTAVVDTTYNTIVIESDRHYQSPDNQYVKYAPMTTIVCLPVGALQTSDILGVLNPWMASVDQTAIAF